MTFFKVGCILLVLLLTPLLVFENNLAHAAEPIFSNLVFKRMTSVTDPSPGNSTLQIRNLVVSSTPDRFLLVGVSLGNLDTRSDTTVTSVNYGPSGDNCPGTQPLSIVSNSQSSQANQTSNVFYSLVAPAVGTCDVIVTLSQNQGGLPGFVTAPAVGAALLFTGVDQTNSFEPLIAANTATGNSNTPSVSSTNPTADHLVVDLMSVSASGGNTHTAGANQAPNLYKASYSGSPNFKMGISKQSGSAGTDPMTWNLAPNSGPWSSTSILLRSCDISSSCTVVSAPSSSSSGDSNGSCDGDCTPPTLGVDKNNKRVVTGGFSFNENPTDAEFYFTPYPLITAYVGEENTIALEIYENDGPGNLAHVGVAFGLGYGESFSQSQAIINWDRDFNGTETVSKVDPDNVLENIRVVSKEVSCSAIGSNCTELIFYHTFRAPLIFNMVGTNMWDHDRNAWQNYFNHGLQVVGDSLNPPKTYDGIYKGKIYSLNETGKNISIDEFGDTWTFDKGIWNRDYVPMKKTDPPLINANKSWAINHVYKGDYEDISHSIILDRNLNYFVIQKDYQKLIAESILEEMCPKCFDDSFEEIDDIFYYDLPEESERISTSLNQTMMYESQKANNTLSKMMNLFYPGKVYD